MLQQRHQAASPVGLAMILIIAMSFGCARRDDSNMDTTDSTDSAPDATSRQNTDLQGPDSSRVEAIKMEADAAHVGGLGFGNFHLGMDPRALVARYPTSKHRMTMISGGRGWSYHPKLNDDPELSLFSEQFAAGKGTYIIRVAAKEAAELIYYVQLEFARGTITKMRLSFGVPIELRGRVKKRTCESVMQSLVEQYGPPMREVRPYSEERAWHEPKIWLDEETELWWDCAEFAIILRRLKDE